MCFHSKKNIGQLNKRQFKLIVFHEKLNGLIDMPKEIDYKVAKHALEGMKINIDTQTQEQKDYGESYVI